MWKPYVFWKSLICLHAGHDRSDLVIRLIWFTSPKISMVKEQQVMSEHEVHRQWALIAISTRQKRLRERGVETHMHVQLTWIFFSTIQTMFVSQMAQISSHNWGLTSKVASKLNQKKKEKKSTHRVADNYLLMGNTGIWWLDSYSLLTH